MSKSQLHKIYIVDDDIFCLSLYKEFFAKLGYANVSCFNGGRECVDKLSSRPDLILLDYYMDDMNGLEVLEHVKQKSPDTMVVLVSGNENAEIAAEGKQNGAYDYIVKSSINIDVLKSITEKIGATPANQSSGKSFFQKMKAGFRI